MESKRKEKQDRTKPYFSFLFFFFFFFDRREHFKISLFEISSFDCTLNQSEKSSNVRKITVAG